MDDLNPVAEYVGLSPEFIADLAEWLNTRKDCGKFRVYDLTGHTNKKYQICFWNGSVKGGSIIIRSTRSGIGSMLDIDCPRELNAVWDKFLKLMRNAEKERMKKRTQEGIIDTPISIPTPGNSKAKNETQSEPHDYVTKMPNYLRHVMKYDDLSVGQAAKKYVCTVGAMKSYRQKIRFATGKTLTQRRKEAEDKILADKKERNKFGSSVRPSTVDTSSDEDW